MTHNPLFSAIRGPLLLLCTSKNTINFRFIRFFLVLFLTTTPFYQANSAVLVETDFAEVSQKSILVFQGRAIKKRFKRHPTNGRPMTYVHFLIEDIIKGEYPNSELELAFEGGTIDGVTMMISDLEIPIVGERGVYFVESLAGDLANPLFGWHQGHYLIQKDISGVEKVIRSDSHAGLEKSTQGSLKNQSVTTFDKSGMNLRNFKREIIFRENGS